MSTSDTECFERHVRAIIPEIISEVHDVVLADGKLKVNITSERVPNHLHQNLNGTA